jgi:hypothetical protein
MQMGQHICDACIMNPTRITKLNLQNVLEDFVRCNIAKLVQNRHGAVQMGP